jgi:hypothetical protein
VAGASITAWCGCGRDVRLAGKKVRHVQAAVVTRYGITLDQSATPEQAAFVALRAIREDALAANPADRDAAIQVQFDVCAPGAIESKNRTSLPEDDYVYHVVTHWTPTVGHYVGGFEVEPEKAIARLKNRGPKPAADDVAETELAMEVADPAGDPAAGVVMLIWLAQDNGLWRVTHLGFEPKRALAGAAASHRPVVGS